MEVRIGDSAIALALGEAFPQDLVTRGSIYVHVADADAVFARALQAGATTTIVTPHDEAYGERIGAVRDAFGNVWFTSIYLGGP